MCFYDADGPEAFREWWPVARKEHRCAECRGIIPAGTKHYACSGIWDGRPDRFRICMTCDDARRIVEAHENEEGCEGAEAICPYGYLDEYLAEIAYPLDGLRLDAQALVTHRSLSLALALWRMETGTDHRRSAAA